MIKIQLIKTNNGCYIYKDYTSYQEQISELYFDGEKAEPTFCKDWYYLKEYPKKVQAKRNGECINGKYIIKDKGNITKRFPEVIPANEMGKYYHESLIHTLYDYYCDQMPDYFEDLEAKIQTICEIDKIPDISKISYDAIHNSYIAKTPEYKITNKDVKHQLIDEIIFPEILLGERPAKFTSKQMYDITRQYIRDNIDNKYARITSDYDFCFEVKKNIPLYEPKTISYHDIFARTKNQREQVHFKKVDSKEITVFEMTSDEDNYKGYTPISAMTGKNDKELKEKVDTWLTGVIEYINKPLSVCPHCKGTGYIGDIDKIVVDKIDCKK